MNRDFRVLCIALLDDEDGLSLVGYETLRGFNWLHAGHAASDILDAVKAQDGRYFLPKDHGFDPEGYIE